MTASLVRAPTERSPRTRTNAPPGSPLRRQVASSITSTVHAPSQITKHGGISFVKEDFPTMGVLTQTMWEPTKQLLADVIKAKKVVQYNTTFYIYCSDLAMWAQLYSELASSELVQMTSINAPVNYAIALRNTYQVMKMAAYRIGEMKESVCIGSYRLTFSAHFTDAGVIVRFKPHPHLMGKQIYDTSYDRICTFVTSPIRLPSPTICPTEVMVRSSYEIINMILDPLTVDQKLDFLWRMGNALKDPIRYHSVIVFYGPDGSEGKTTLAKMISCMLADAVEWTKSNLFSAEATWPSADTIFYLCQKRIIVCDETKVSKGLNYTNIKKFTSEAPISMDGRTGVLSQTSIVISNEMSFSERHAINDSVGRRLVIYHMKKKMRNKTPPRPAALDGFVALRFMSLCLAIASTYDRAPPSLPIAMYTIFRKSINRITAGLVYDSASDKWQCLAATSAMAVRSCVSVEKLCQAFEAMSPKLVCRPEVGCPYIVSVRPRNTALTEKGRTKIMKDKKMYIVDIELLKGKLARL